jgi:hypothetical protein
MPRPGPPVDRIWLKEQFNELNRDHNLIFARLNAIEAALAKLSPNPNVTPALAEAIIAVSKIAVSIDKKVPDKNVPPGTATLNGKETQ